MASGVERELIAITLGAIRFAVVILQKEFDYPIIYFNVEHSGDL